MDGLNRAVRKFATRDANAELVDWHGAAASNPGLLDADWVHATPSGYAYRARLFARAIATCLAFSGASGAPPGAAPDAGQTVHPGPRRGIAARARAAQRRQPEAAAQPVSGPVLALTGFVGAAIGTFSPPLGSLARLPAAAAASSAEAANPAASD